MKKYLPLILLLIVASTIVFIIKDTKEQPYLTVIGRAKMADGLGRQAVELISALKNDVTIGYLPAHRSYLEDIPEDVLPFITNPNPRLGKVVIYESSLPDPNASANKKLSKVLKGKKTASQIRIAYSMIESSKIPEKWSELLNDYFDAVVVPDEFLVEVYKTSGVAIPIFVIPLGLNLEPFLTQPLKEKKNSPFCFINAASLIARKNHEGLIRAFHKAFGNNPSVELHINYRNFHPDTLHHIHHLIESLDLKNIFLTNKKLSSKEYLDFFLKADALVNISKGEGFSIQPREAMALGLPVIVSDNTAQSTIVKTGLVTGITCPQREPSYNPFMNCTVGEEYLPDCELAAKAMSELYENYEQNLLKAKERREWARTYQYENLKNTYLTLIKPSKVLLGHKDEVRGNTLITTSPELYRKYLTLNKDP